MEMIFMNTENSKTSDPHKLNLNFSKKRLDLKSLDEHIALQNLSNLSIYYRWIYRKAVQNNNLKIIAPTWNDDFKLPDGSYCVSDIQNYIDYIIKKHLTLTT